MKLCRGNVQFQSRGGNAEDMPGNFKSYAAGLCHETLCHGGSVRSQKRPSPAHNKPRSVLISKGLIATLTLCISAALTPAMAQQGGNARLLEFSPAASAAGPEDCPEMGDLCPDGTVYVGQHPSLQANLFISPADQGTTHDWKTSFGTDDIVHDSVNDGKANSNQVKNLAAFPAMKACKDLMIGGRHDWYLPSGRELQLLSARKNAIQTKGHAARFQDDFYWSSTERDPENAYVVCFSDDKNDCLRPPHHVRVRCMRRD